MATKSIMKNIDIKKKKSCHAFVLALEHAKNKKSKRVHMSRACKEIKGEKIKEIFGSDK